MQPNDKAVLIYSTFPSVEAAEAAGTPLVEQGLAACVNILPGMTSIYRWQGKLVRDAETVMIIKTMAARADAAIAEAMKRHPYDNPAFVILPVAGGAEPFLRWIAEQVSE